MILKNIAEQYRIHYGFIDIVSCLMYNRVLDPASKPGAYDQKSDDVEIPDFKPHDVYRSLDLLKDYSNEIQQSLFKSSSKLIERNTEVLC